MKPIALILLLSVVTGLCAAIASMIGHNFGQNALIVSAILGGLGGVALATLLASRLHFISPNQRRTTFIGGTVGFALASIIATQTLSSPIGPMLSTFLIGLGGLLGSRRSADRKRNESSGA